MMAASVEGPLDSGSGDSGILNLAVQAAEQTHHGSAGSAARILLLAVEVVDHHTLPPLVAVVGDILPQSAAVAEDTLPVVVEVAGDTQRQPAAVVGDSQVAEGVVVDTQQIVVRKKTFGICNHNINMSNSTNPVFPIRLYTFHSLNRERFFSQYVIS